MSADTDVRTGSDAESTVEMLSLTMAVPIDEMPEFLQQRIHRTPPTFTLDELRTLQPDEREKVLKIVERAEAFHRAKARQLRSRGNPVERSADHLQSFLEAARK
jgi:hypothetical protein